MINLVRDIGFEKAVLYTPLAVGVIAVCFDVGYFSAIDINLFTMFSLAEHLVFAMEALPIALTFLLWLVFFVLFLMPISLGVGRRRGRIILQIFITLAVALSAFLWWKYSIFFANAVIIPTVAISMLFAPRLARYSAELRVAFPAAAVFILWLSVPFYAGHLMGYFYMFNDTVSHVVVTRNSSVPGKLVRAGERGILFVRKPGNTAVFMRWDGIYQVELFNEHQF